MQFKELENWAAWSVSLISWFRIREGTERVEGVQGSDRLQRDRGRKLQERKNICRKRLFVVLLDMCIARGQGYRTVVIDSIMSDRRPHRPSFSQTQTHIAFVRFNNRGAQKQPQHKRGIRKNTYLCMGAQTHTINSMLSPVHGAVRTTWATYISTASLEQSLEKCCRRTFCL